MNYRYEIPRDYVVRVTRQPLSTRYDTVQKIAGFVLLAALVIGVITIMAYSVHRADAGVIGYQGQPCDMHTNTMGFCP